MFVKIAVTGKRKGALTAAALGIAAAVLALGAAAQTQNWEPTISGFEQQDKAHPVAPGGIVFTGSSSIVRWKTLEEDMKPLPVLNRGFGGSQYTDINQYAERVVVAYKPKIAVVYAGDNDLAGGTKKTPQSVFADVQKFVQIVHGKLPETWIIVMSIKPSYLRWAQWPQMQEANALIQNWVKTQQRVQYVDVAMPLFEKSGELPRDEFVEDGLHMTPKGYVVWTSVMRPILIKQYGLSSSAPGNGVRSAARRGTMPAPAVFTASANGASPAL